MGEGCAVLFYETTHALRPVRVADTTCGHRTKIVPQIFLLPALENKRYPVYISEGVPHPLDDIDLKNPLNFCAYIALWITLGLLVVYFVPQLIGNLLEADRLGRFSLAALAIYHFGAWLDLITVG